MTAEALLETAGTGRHYRTKQTSHTLLKPYMQLKPSQLENSKCCARVLSHVTWWYLVCLGCIPAFQKPLLLPL